MSSSKGILGIFSDEHKLIEACREARSRNYTKYDAFSPFPIHGIDDAMGTKRSWIPYVTFVAGLTGCVLGGLLQYWTSAVDWPINVGGKPLFSGPAFVPVCFELTVLFGGLATAAALFFAVGIPNVKRTSLDPSFTDDKFGLFVPEEERGYSASEMEAWLRNAGAIEVRRVG